MKKLQSYILFGITAILLSACDARVSTAPPVVEKNTTVVNPPEKVIEKNTTVVNPPAKEEKKVENNTTIVNPPAAPVVEEKKTSTTTTTKTGQ